MQFTKKLATAFFLGVGLLGTASPAAAFDAERRALVMNSVKHFTNAVACQDPENLDEVLIAELVRGSSNFDDLEVSTYIAFPAMPLSCEGKPGFSPVVVRIPEYRPWAAHVDLWATAEIEFRDFPFAPLYLEVLAPNRLLVVGRDHAEGDPMCCPSVMRETVFRWEEGGLWVPEE